MTAEEGRRHVTELALLVKEYQLATSDLRETMHAALHNEVEAIREKHGEEALRDVIRRVEATMNGSKFPL